MEELSLPPSPSAHHTLHESPSNSKAIRVPCTPGALGRWVGARGVQPELPRAGGGGVSAKTLAQPPLNPARMRLLHLAPAQGPAEGQHPRYLFQSGCSWEHSAP